MRRLFVAVALGIAAGIAAAFPVAIALGILNLYLTGHGVRWPERSITYGFVSLSFLDLVLLVCSALAAGAAMYLTLRETRRREG
jgi:hypothetical protein